LCLCTYGCVCTCGCVCVSVSVYPLSMSFPSGTIIVLVIHFKPPTLLSLYFPPTLSPSLLSLTFSFNLFLILLFLLLSLSHSSSLSSPPPSISPSFLLPLFPSSFYLFLILPPPPLFTPFCRIIIQVNIGAATRTVTYATGTLVHLVRTEKE
jgi:hypothetical protein